MKEVKQSQLQEVCIEAERFDNNDHERISNVQQFINENVFICTLIGSRLSGFNVGKNPFVN